MRRLPTTTRRPRAAAVALGAALVAVGLALGLVGGPPAGADDDPAGAGPAVPCAERAEGGDGTVSVVSVSGLLDPVVARLIERSIGAAEDDGRSWVVFQVNSGGSVIGDERLATVVERVRTSSVAVGVWVGPSGSRASEGMAQVAAVACAVGVSPGSRLGDMGRPVVDEERLNAPFVAALDRLEDGTVDAETALELDLAAGEAPVIGSFLIDLDGVPTERVTGEDGRPGRAVRDDAVTFSKLGLGDQLLHTVSSAAVAYLLLLTGLALMVFELYTAGVGVAGLVGAGCTVLACYGLAVLPARGWAVGLLVVTILAYAIDVQTGVPRVWTGIGTVTLVVGSLFLYDGLSLSWITLLVGIGGMLIFALSAMPAMVRTRFSTPTIGRGWMIGEEGETLTAVDPDGVVEVRGASWRARTNRATPVPAGETVRIVEVDGLLLEIEPLEGAARDHRDRDADT